MKLVAYDDSWRVLFYMQALQQLMCEINEQDIFLTIGEFASLLAKLGYLDITPYHEKEKNMSISQIVAYNDRLKRIGAIDEKE